MRVYVHHLKTLACLLAVFIAFAVTSGCDENGTNPNDNLPPTGNNVVEFIAAKGGDLIAFTGTFNDDSGIKQISVEYAAWSLNEVIEPTGNPITFDISVPFTVPANAVNEHVVTITATDAGGNSSEFPVTVLIDDLAPTYDQLYAVGGFMWWWGWDHPELAYIMDKDPDAPEWFETTLHIWGGDFNTVKFLSEPSWYGSNWGLIDQSNPGAGLIDDPDSDAIILDDKGLNPAYYKLRFNPNELEYQAEFLTPNIPVQPEMFIVGNGFPEYPDLDWNPSEAIPMEANLGGYGEHIFGIYGLEFSDDVSLKFIGQNGTARRWTERRMPTG